MPLANQSTGLPRSQWSASRQRISVTALRRG